MSIDSVAKQKSMAFARRIVRLYQYLSKELLAMLAASIKTSME